MWYYLASFGHDNKKMLMSGSSLSDKYILDRSTEDSVPIIKICINLII